MEKIILFVVVFFLSKEVFPQSQGQALVDSLHGALPGIPPGNSLQRAKVLNDLGKAYLNISAYTEASACFYECKQISERLNEKRLLAETYRNIALISFSNKDLVKADEENNKSLAIYKELKDIPGQGAALKSMAGDYLELVLSLKDTAKNRIKAEQYYNQALQLYEQANDKKGEAGIYMNQSILCFADYQKKIELALLAKKIWDTLYENSNSPTINVGNIGVAYLDIVRYDTLHRTKPSAIIPASNKEKLDLAEKYIDSAITMGKSKQDVENIAYFTGVLAELQAVKGDYKNAYLNFRDYQNTTDSIFSQEHKNKIAALENKNEMDKRTLEIEQQKLQVKEQKKNTFIALALLLIAAAIGFLYYRISAVRRQKNEELTRLNKELDDANKLKAKFFGILSHDLRSPVANLVSFLNLRKIDPNALSREEAQDREIKIGNSAQTLLEAMESMLLWSKSQMEQFRAERKPVRIDALFSYLKKIFMDNKNITLSFSNEDEVFVETDENFLKTIMYNLTANAVKALTNRADGQIEWKAWHENDQFFLSISDNGPGINKEKIKALYDETAISGSAHGLGLHIIRDMAKAINCHIEMNPVTGAGTKFILSF